MNGYECGLDVLSVARLVDADEEPVQGLRLRSRAKLSRNCEVSRGTGNAYPVEELRVVERHPLVLLSRRLALDMLGQGGEGGAHDASPEAVSMADQIAAAIGWYALPTWIIASVGSRGTSTMPAGTFSPPTGGAAPLNRQNG